VRRLAVFVVIAGVVMIGLGAALYFGLDAPYLGRLPGDVHIERPDFSIYLPITSCILISLFLSLVVFLISKIR